VSKTSFLATSPHEELGVFLTVEGAGLCHSNITLLNMESTAKFLQLLPDLAAIAMITLQTTSHGS
jgi:hypothetical protein